MRIGIDRRQRQEEPRTTAAGIGDGVGYFGIGGLVAQPGAQTLDGSRGFVDVGAGLQVEIEQKLISIIGWEKLTDDMSRRNDDAGT